MFVADRAAFDARLDPLLACLRDGIILWLAYPKRASPLAVDLDRDTLRDAVAHYGRKVVGQIAIDADWSALRLKASE